MDVKKKTSSDIARAFKQETAGMDAMASMQYMFSMQYIQYAMVSKNRGREGDTL